jgi:hypothetical protein
MSYYLIRDMKRFSSLLLILLFWFAPVQAKWVAYPLYTTAEPTAFSAQFGGGSWIGIPGVKWGTAGIPVVLNGTLLGYATANHVLSKSDWNDIHFGDYYYGMSEGAPVGFSTGDNFIPVKRDGLNYIDIGLAYKEVWGWWPSDYFTTHIKGLGEYPIGDYAQCREFSLIVKQGAASGLTEGVVAGCSDTVFVIDDQGKEIEFVDQVRILPLEDKPFAIPGDSGSAVIDVRQNKLLGIVEFSDGKRIWVGKLENIGR